MAVNDIISVKAFTSCKPANQNISVALNVWHYRVAAQDGAGVAAQMIADVYANALAAPYKGLFNLVTRFEGVIAQKVWPLPLAIPGKSVLGAGVGALTGEQLPLQCCGAVTKLSPFAGRRHRGRMYVPFPTEDFNDPQQRPSQAYIDLVVPLLNAWLLKRVIGTLPDAATLFPVVFHPTFTPVFTDIELGQIRSYWTTQRRRVNAWRSDNLPF
jgi:hypothetical protein